MSHVEQIRIRLLNAVTAPKEKVAIFFKTGPGGYAEGDQFLGVKVPFLRRMAKEFIAISLDEVQEILSSKMNEERLLALFILVYKYEKSSSPELREKIYQFYLHHLIYVNNWNLVDASAHLILGAHLKDKDRKILLKLAKSSNIWERRIAIVSTWYYIRKSDLEWTFKIASLLLKDSHDLIHKAVGWMLREAGKKDEKLLIHFLDQHADQMPRTMLRYAIEKFSDAERKKYMTKKSRNSHSK